MLAKRIPTILPNLSFEEALEITKIHSIAGLLPSKMPLITKRPFRAPHHTISPIALVGGNRNPKPGEVSLAHYGVLFLDELPELINIIKGDMAIVGPRPLLVRYLPYYTEEERHRHDVKPGLTGLAQVSGRNLLKWEERFKIDVNYVKNISFKIDMKIFFLTIKKVLLGSDIQPSTDSEGYFDDIRMKEIENGK